MILGIMQPYFFPYPEHFRLLAACDLWVVFDSVKYQRRSWMNRNRILNRDREWSYLSVPVKRGRSDEPVSETSILPGSNWREGLEDSLRVYAHAAPFFDQTGALVADVLDGECSKLVDLNMKALEGVCAHLGIDTEVRRLSTLDLDLPDECAPGEWALHISRALGATEYRNPSGGRSIFDPAQFETAGIQLSFHEHRELRYPTGPFEFVPNLSILDAMMWVSQSELHSWVAPRG